MSDNFYTTTTAALRATKADIRWIDAKQIKLNGKPIPSTVFDDRGDFVTDQDLWGTSVTTDENGVVHVSHNFLSNPNGTKAWNSSVNSVKDNKAYASTDATGESLCNIQTEMIRDGWGMFYNTSFTSFSGDLSNLVDGSWMFYRTPLTSFDGDLSSLVIGENMFAETSLTSFDSKLSSLVDGNNMFYRTPLTSFDGDLSHLVNGDSMFQNTSLTSFISDLSSLVNGYRMFRSTPLKSFSVDLSSLVNGSDMFASTSLTSFSKDLSSLTDGSKMFQFSPLTSFNSELSSLVNGSEMFADTALTSFSKDLNSLVDGSQMFSYTPIASFSKDLSSLVIGTSMFFSTSLTSFSSGLSSLVDGSQMFRNTSLTSFNGDLNNLINGYFMFSKTHKRGYYFIHYGMVSGVSKQITVHLRAEGLTSFIGDLGSLQSGYGMFGDASDVTYKNEEKVTETTKDIAPLDEQSVMIIADTIKDLNGFSDWDSSISEAYRGVIHIGYDSEVCDAAKIEEYCTEIMNKGWTVYLNGTVQTTDDGIEGIATLAEDGTVTVTPVPYYCKPVEVDQKEAEWTDGEKYYIILGAQTVIGDDLSTYGMFTSIENAAMNMGFTPYEYVEEETETIEEN